ncbi:uncharacterized protein EI97DRAFT_48757 [Westerdykella ornata]|uniref:Uncharacterized protein n=1 Tax=Westerdykella ornata TaxID=318751 RepID=A0A6A6JHF9_WESOR|nr:uncharacterized protein EI97DRAFT_48757 [Westerdykella ornata]KAF2276090.1 hypothetical protein EI97DRAFT_48757 [Westerdykella ornata]
MAKEFFMSWALWQKMTFVLACAIVVTIFIGLAKLQYDKIKLRKYTKVEKGKQTQTPEMLEAQPISEEPKDEVPFGIRAIESGIEVDGVWISRSNTPVASSRSSMTEVKLPRSHTSSQLELPKAIHASSSRSSLASSFDRAVSAERLATNASRSSSPGRDTSSAARARPPAAPSSRYSGSNFQRNSATLQVLEGAVEPPSSSAPRSGKTSPQHSGKSSARTSDESDYMALPEGTPYEPAYIYPKQASLTPVDPRTDLNLLQSHRLSHVAETGQLTPRVRRPAHSGEWANAGDNVRSTQEIATSNGVDYFVPRQKTPSPPLNSITEPALSPSVPSSSSYSQDGHPSNQGKQAVPLLETYASQAYQYQQPQTYQPRGPQYEHDEEVPRHEVQTAQNSQRQSQSQVLRKVNSGFEILRPGTLGEPPSPENEVQSPAGEKRKPKRLQKRRTSSGTDRTSHFVEQV